MPYSIRKISGLYYVINKKTGKKKNKTGYKSRKDAEAYMRALYAHSKDA